MAQYHGNNGDDLKFEKTRKSSRAQIREGDRSASQLLFALKQLLTQWLERTEYSNNTIFNAPPMSNKEVQLPLQAFTDDSFCHRFSAPCNAASQQSRSAPSRQGRSRVSEYHQQDTCYRQNTYHLRTRRSRSRSPPPRSSTQLTQARYATRPRYSKRSVSSATFEDGYGYPLAASPHGRAHSGSIGTVTVGMKSLTLEEFKGGMTKNLGEHDIDSMDWISG